MYKSRSVVVPVFLLWACSAGQEPGGATADAGVATRCGDMSQVTFTRGGDGLSPVSAGLHTDGGGVDRVLLFGDTPDACAVDSVPGSPWQGAFLFFHQVNAGRYPIDPDCNHPGPDFDDPPCALGQRGFCEDSREDCEVAAGELVVDLGEDDVRHPDDCLVGSFDVTTLDGTAWAGSFVATVCD